MRRATLRLAGVGFSAGRTDIIAGIDLALRPGELTAVIGPSGCGKSTMLRCAAALRRATAGAVTLGGADVWPMRTEFRRSLGFVPQDDVVQTALTARQALWYSGRLRLGADFADGRLDKRVESIAGLLGLSERLDLRVRRLSGGQRKRVNIGVELVADPDLLILDEPASGLDPATEGDLVRLLKSMSRAGRTVVLTTHSMEYLSEVDKVVLLVKGRLAFAGALPELLAHFGVSDPALVYKALRAGDAAGWASRWRGSALAARELRD